MTLIVETGAGLSNADSFVSVADADTYHTNFGNADWTGTDAVKEVALRKATSVLSLGFDWDGSRASSTQSLAWPRSDVYAFGSLVSDDVVPTEVKNACAELALRALTEDLLPDEEESKLKHRVKVGSLEEETTYVHGSSAAKRYPTVTILIQPYLGARGIRANRA